MSISFSETVEFALSRVGKRGLRRAVLSIGLLMSGYPPFSCIAGAETANPGAQPTTGDTGSKLEEIIVTATRREESLQKVPISIDAFSQGELMDAGIKSIGDLAAVTPGLQFQSPTGHTSTLTTISIRGMNSNTGPGVVGIYIDDTPIQVRFSSDGNVGNLFPALFDLNRVEVDRGPQGTLFGSGSEAGAVRFITNSPSLTDFSGFSHAEGAVTDRGTGSYEGGAAAGGPIVQDQIGFRFSVWARHDGGFVDRLDTATDQVAPNSNQDDKLAARLAFAFKVNEDVRVTPSVYYQSTGTDDTGRFWDLFSDASAGRFVNAQLRPEVVADHFVLPSLKAEAHLPFAEMTAVASYISRKVYLTTDYSTPLGALGVANYGSPLGPEVPTSESDYAPTDTGTEVRGITEEIRLASNQPDAFVTWVAGIFNDHRSQTDYYAIYSTFIDPINPLMASENQVAVDEQTAIFGQGDFHLTQKWTATLGARVEKAKSDFRVINGNGLFNQGDPPQGSATLKETPWTPRIAVSYQADSDNLLYASAGKGFRVGGGNVPVASFCQGTAPNTFKSDYAWSYEVGAKDRLFGGRMQIDSSVFYINWSDVQQQLYLQCGLSYTANSGDAVSKGFDLALQAIVTDGLRLNLDVGYVDAYFTKNISGPTGSFIIAGDKIGLLPQVNPPWDVNTSLNYEIPLSAEQKIHLRAEYQYHSRNPGPFITQIPSSPSYYPLITANPPIHITNLRGGYTWGKLDVSLFVDNVFNSHPLLDSFQFTAASNLVTNTTLRPRTAGIAANWEF